MKSANPHEVRPTAVNIIPFPITLAIRERLARNPSRTPSRGATIKRVAATPVIPGRAQDALRTLLAATVGILSRRSIHFAESIRHVDFSHEISPASGTCA